MLKIEEKNVLKEEFVLKLEKRLKVLILATPPLLVHGIRFILEDSREFEVVSEFNRLENFLKQTRIVRPDILIIDGELPNKDIDQFIQHFNNMGHHPRLILLGSSQEESILIQGIRTGAAAVIPRELNPNKLLEIVRQVARGKKLLNEALISNPAMIRQVVKGFKTSSLSEPEISPSLSERELEVLQLMSKGDSNKEIGRSLKISDQTVKNHIASIFRKLNVDRRTRAVLVALENGLVGDVPYPKFQPAGIFESL